MKKVPKEAKSGGPDLESRLYGVEDMPSAEESKLYMPKNGLPNEFVEDAKEYWRNLKPKTANDFVQLAVPNLQPAYILWKMPPRLHKRLNDVLGMATEIVGTKNPEVGMGLGLAYCVSQVVYGMKTLSGKHVASGLVGVSEHVRKMGKEDHPILEKIEGIVNTYFKKFDPSYSKGYSPA